MRIKKRHLIIILVIFTIVNASILDFLGVARKVTAERVRQWGLSMHPAMWAKPIANGGIQCRLCPFKCVIEEGERGICGIRAVVNDTLRALTYSRPASLNIDPIEKKPLFHFTPNTKSLSVATVGCNLSCNFCQNWSLSQTLPEEAQTRIITPSDLVRTAKETGSTTISYTYSEPTVFYEYMFETAKLAHEAEIRNLMVTCGFIEEEPLRELCKYLDAANVDLKGWSDDFYRDYTRSMKAPVLRALKILVEEGVWVEITNLLIPDANDDPDDIRKLCRWVADSLGTHVPIHFSRFHPNYKLTDRPATPGATLEMAHEIAKQEGIEFVYIGNVRGNPYEDTFCPNCGETVIARIGYFIEKFELEGGQCKFCGHEIAGVWE